MRGNDPRLIDAMQILSATLILVVLLVAYAVLNTIRYPWHTLVFVVVGIGLTLAMGGVFHWRDASVGKAGSSAGRGTSLVQASSPGGPR